MLALPYGPCSSRELDTAGLRPRQVGKAGSCNLELALGRRYMQAQALATHTQSMAP